MNDRTCRRPIRHAHDHDQDQFTTNKSAHYGVDFGSNVRAKVYSTAPGTVKVSGWKGRYGRYVEIDHGNGYITAYAHLSTRNVKVGDKVFRGQKIGEVGNTGRSTAPHLHYEVQYQKKAVDPTPFYFEISIN